MVGEGMLLREGSKGWKGLLRSKIRREMDERRDRIVRESRSLREYWRLGDSSFYEIVGRKERAGLAWVRLGGWRWQGKKDELGIRRCHLCHEKDGLELRIRECKELRWEREEALPRGVEVERWNWGHWIRIRDGRVLKGLGSFLNRARKKSGEGI